MKGYSSKAVPNDPSWRGFAKGFGRIVVGNRFGDAERLGITSFSGTPLNNQAS